MSAPQQESAALKWGGLLFLLALATVAFVAVAGIWLERENDPATQPPLPAAISRVPQEYWHGVGTIEQAFKSLSPPDDSLITSERYADFTAGYDRFAESLDRLAEKLRALPVSGVDAELIEYSLALASCYQHRAVYARRVGQLGSEMQRFRNKIVGPAAFMRGLVRPDKALDDIFGDGPDDLMKKAAAVVAEEHPLILEEVRVAERRAALRVLLTRRHGHEFQ